ncbi:MAG: isocitrate/isopropylmalate dehydrogenase family protein [Haloferacaceae archaeon]
MALEIGVLDGDGIGPEIVSAAVRVVSALDLDVEFVELPVGWDAYDEYGTTVPTFVLERVGTLDGWFLGPILSGQYPEDDPAGGNPSPVFRTEFDLYSNLRPIRSYDGLGPAGMDVAIFRQNTEGFLADRNMHVGDGQFMPTEDTAMSVRVVTREESRRIARAAFAYADAHGMDVTAVHKGNVLRNAGDLFLEAVETVAESYPDVAWEPHLVDSFAMELAANPTEHGVVVTTNLFGDILSDEAAGVVGSLGIAPGLNHNDEDGYAMAQATHGAAPDIAGEGVANPTSTILSGALLLEWLGGQGVAGAAKAAETVDHAVTRTINAGVRTPDIGGDATTAEFTDAVIGRVQDA